MCSGHVSHSSETTGIYVVKSAMAEHSMNAECHIKLQNMVIPSLNIKYMYIIFKTIEIDLHLSRRGFSLPEKVMETSQNAL